MPPIPDLTGQPAWVVVVVAFLFVSGALGLAYLRARGKAAPEEDPPEVRPGGAPQLEAAAPGPAGYIDRAIQHLAEVAEREAQESRDARAETREVRAQAETHRQEADDLRRQLVECRQEVLSARAELARCEARAELLVQQAHRQGEQQ